MSIPSMGHNDFLTPSFFRPIMEDFIMAEEIKCTIVKKIGVLSKKDNGYSKQINLVSWNDREAKLDIREWSPADKAIKGITLTDEEGRNLLEALKTYYAEEEQDLPF